MDETTELEQEPAIEVETQEEPSVDAPESVEPEADAKVEPTVSEFQPDYTYKFKGEVKELDDFWRGLIKDPESQKKVRDYIERAEALPDYKEQVKTFEETVNDWKPKVELLETFQNTYNSAKTADDHIDLLNEIGYDVDTLKNLVREVLVREQMPEDQKKYFEQARSSDLEKKQLMTQNEMVRQELNSIRLQTTEQQIGLEFQKPENNSVVSAYESVNGQGSFKQLFLERGAYYSQLEGRHVAPAEVMAKVAKEFAPFLSRQGEGSPIPTEGSGQMAVIKPKQAPIPSVGTRSGSSPTKNAIKSLDDLKALHRQMTGQEE